MLSGFLRFFISRNREKSKKNLCFDDIEKTEHFVVKLNKITRYRVFLQITP
jgi:hypothetical protein